MLTVIHDAGTPLVSGWHSASCGLIGRRRSGADEAVRLLDQHVAWPDRGAEAALIDVLTLDESLGPGWTSTTSSRFPPTIHSVRCRNTLLLPHIGYVTSDNYRTFYRHAVEDILAFTSGNPSAAHKVGQAGPRPARRWR